MRLVRELFGYSGPVGFGAAIRILLLDVGVFFAVLMITVAWSRNFVRPGSSDTFLAASAIALAAMMPFMGVSLFVRLLQNIPIFAVKPDAAGLPDGCVNDGLVAVASANRKSGQPMTRSQWALILTIFFVIMIFQPARIVGTAWSFLSPASYAAHMDNDEVLADAAAYNPRLIKVLLARAARGDRSAMYFYGFLYDTGNYYYTPSIPRKNPPLAISWYQRAVALDDQGAERNLGIDYFTGAGVPRDYKKAAQLLEMAAAKNDNFADYYLGVMLERGQGEPVNLSRAFKLEQASAAQGFVAAKREVGSMYFAGNGVPKNLTLAIYFWKLAAQCGDADATIFLAESE